MDQSEIACLVHEEASLMRSESTISILYVASSNMYSTHAAADADSDKDISIISSFPAEFDLLFHLRFLIILGPGHLDTVMECLKACRSGSDVQVCTAQEMAYQAAHAVSRSLDTSYNEYRGKSAGMLEGHEGFKRAVVIAAYADHSAAIWHTYNQARNSGMSMINIDVLRKVDQIKKKRQPFEVALASILANETQMRVSIEKALSEPEFETSKLKDIEFGTAKKVCDMVKLLEDKWVIELRALKPLD